MIIPVIISGGSGTRLWPVSREGHPKPFMIMPDGESLLSKTYLRAASICDGAAEIVTVTNREHFFESRDHFNAAELHEYNARYILEPVGRNTAPAIIAAALSLREQYGDEAIMMVMPADHLIEDQTGFIKATKHAASLAKQGYLVTYGIQPTTPETGFGYIECGQPLDAQGAHTVARFVEKPDLATAEQYLVSDKFLWNSGIFCFSIGTLLAEVQQHADELLMQTKKCIETSKSNTQGKITQVELDCMTFNKVEDISIDYALIEASAQVAVIPAQFDWNDIGNWVAFSKLTNPDVDNNRALGDCLFINTTNTYAQSSERLIATVGVDNLIIIDTPDALLVAHADQAQQVREVVKQLKKRKHDAYRLHKTVFRPWGGYTILEEGSRFKIKRLEVKPGAALSLQMHHHRSEHWIVVQGMAKVINGVSERLINTNESTFIPAGHQHRLENPGVIDLVLIEVQSGEYLGEDDIVRFADQYGRVAQ